jgi:hypothetical protein
MLFFVVIPLLIILVLFFELIDVSIPYLPLSHFTPKIICYWRASRSSSLLNRWVDSLDLSTLIIKLVSHCLFDSIHIFSRPRLFLFSLSLNLFKFSFANVLDLFLNFVFVRGSVDVVSLETEVHD